MSWRSRRARHIKHAYRYKKCKHAPLARCCASGVFIHALLRSDGRASKRFMAPKTRTKRSSRPHLLDCIFHGVSPRFGAASRLRSGAIIAHRHAPTIPESALLSGHSQALPGQRLRYRIVRVSQVEYRAATKFASTRPGGRRLTAAECGAVCITPTIQQENAGSCHHCVEEQGARHRVCSCVRRQRGSHKSHRPAGREIRGDSASGDPPRVCSSIIYQHQHIYQLHCIVRKCL